MRVYGNLIARSSWDQSQARLYIDIMANVMQGKGISRDADPVVFGQYFAAAARAIELLRPVPRTTNSIIAITNPCIASGETISARFENGLLLNIM